jgi:hypothetical protein|tara:strand:- start:269 stop:844 length:576 start_codon:yes stop_codon:yes gene_type:complete
MTTAQLIERIEREEKWIEEHGSDLAGYIARYGDPGVTERWFGDGGTLIFEADTNSLKDLRHQLSRRRDRHTATKKAKVTDAPAPVTPGKHIPGPWKATRVPGVKSVAVNGPGYTNGKIAQVYGFKFNGATSDRENQEANASLIAAAPELLEALKRVVTDWNVRGDFIRETALGDIVRGAIEKAEKKVRVLN